MPQIKTTDQTYVTDARKPIVMAVPYSAYPQAKADWLYNNLSLPKDNIYTSADRTEYRLRDPMKADEGRYKVIIKNKHGEGEAFINLEVIGEFHAKSIVMWTLLNFTFYTNFVPYFSDNKCDFVFDFSRCPWTREEPAGD